MAIAFKDFFPEVTKRGILLKRREVFSATVARANAWVSSSGVRVINIETVVVPNLGGKEMAKADFVSDGGFFPAPWQQFVRIWYEGPNSSA